SAASIAMIADANATAGVVPRRLFATRTLPLAEGRGTVVTGSRHDCTLIISRTLMLQARMDRLAFTAHQCALDELSTPVPLPGFFLLVDHGLEERQQVLGVKARCIDRNFAGEVERSGDRHALVLHDLVGLGELAIAAALGGEIDNHRAWL